MKKFTLNKTLNFWAIFLLLVVISQQTFGATIEQMKAGKVTLEIVNSKISDALDALSKNSSVRIFYKSDLKDLQKRISIDLKEEPLQNALSKVLANTSLGYEFSNDGVVITTKERPVTNVTQQKKITINGRVVGDDKKPITGATVFVLGTTNGAISDEDGLFSISCVDGSTLEISCVGMVTATYKVNDADKGNIVIAMKKSTMVVDDVVVTGYQRLERRKMTSSISTVNMENLKSINQPSIDKLLQGQVAGMTIMNTSGAPGSVPQIRIRGTSTLSGNVQPLWVVDGIILDDPVNASVDDIMTNRNLIASGIGGVNVEDIESINVLKDAAATAIYGTRAANGVIVITSKKGTAGRTTVRYSGHLNVSMRPNMEDAYMMNSKDRIGVNLEMMDRGVFSADSYRAGEYGTATDFERAYVDAADKKISWGDFENQVRQLEEVNTDWFKHLFRNAVTHRHNISVSGGTEKTTFYLSGSYMDEQSTAKDVGQKTYTGSVKVYTKPWKNLRLGGMLDLNVRENDSFFSADSWENPYEWSIYTTRAQNAFKEDGSYNYMYYNGMEYNFLENREASWRESKNFGIRGNFDVEWKILPDLIFTSMFAYTQNSTTDEDISTEKSYFVKKRKEDVTIIDGYTAVQIWKDGGYYKGRNTNTNSVTFRNQLSYMPIINQNHRFDVMLGHEVRKSKNQYTTDEIYGYVHDRGRQQIPQWDLIKKLGTPYWKMQLDNSAAISYYGVFGYTFRERYTVSANARVDGSNRFGIKTNELFQPLWSVGFNYQLKNEKFLEQVDWVSYLTLKGTYGTQGNIASQAYSDLVTNIGKVDDVNTDGFLEIIAPKNPYLKWEKNYNANIAIEFGFLQRRIQGVVEYYNKKGVDLLGNKQVSQVTGFNTVQVNWASMKNSGFEFSISSINIDTKKFRWTTNLNVGYNENKVLDVYTTPTYTSLTDAQRSNNSASAVIGKPINGLWSYQYAGLNEQGRASFYDQKGEKVLFGMNNVDGLVYSGTTMPPVQGGITNTINYAKFTLSVLFVGSFGNVVRLRNLSQGYAFGFPDPTKNMSADWNNRWRKAGDEKLGHNVPVLESDPWEIAVTGKAPYNGKMYDNSDLRTAKGNFVRLQNLSLGYDIYSEKIRRSGIQNINIMLQGNNLAVWHSSKIKGQDPEATGSMMKYSDTRTANVSFGNTYLPLPRTYSLSVSIQF